MIGLDAHVLIRYLTKDDASQYAKAKRFIDEAVAQHEPLLIDGFVLCEVAWVLETVYGCSWAEIADVLERILDTAQFEVEWPQEARHALRDARSTSAGFADALIGRVNRTLGATDTATFDRDLKSLETFRVL
jgi:predicted nucleic-acid-binding protein